jgi:hypothetical protein
MVREPAAVGAPVARTGCSGARCGARFGVHPLSAQRRFRRGLPALPPDVVGLVAVGYWPSPRVSYKRTISRQYWFLCFIRSGPGAVEPADKLTKSLARFNGLEFILVLYEERLCTQFEVYSPDGSHHPFGAALLRAADP